MSITIYYIHEAEFLLTNASNISFERKPSNAEYGTYLTLTVLAVTVTWHKFRTSASTRPYVRDKLTLILITWRIG